MLEIEASPLRAFHGNPAIKADRLVRVAAHRAADELQRGMTGEGGKGCAVWCTLDAYDHARYPIEIGVPEWLARVEDTLFERMSVDRAMEWPTAFLDAIAVGADLEKAKAPFLIHVLRSTLSHFDHAENPAVLAAVEGSIALWQRMDIGSPDWEKAAARGARVARGARGARAARAAEAAAWASEAAARVARAARAARAAAWAAWAAWAARASEASEASEAAARGARVAWAAEASEAAARVAWASEAAARVARAASLGVGAATAYDDYAAALLTILRGIAPAPATDGTGGQFDGV